MTLSEIDNLVSSYRKDKLDKQIVEKSPPCVRNPYRTLLLLRNKQNFVFISKFYSKVENKETNKIVLNHLL